MLRHLELGAPKLIHISKFSWWDQDSLSRPRRTLASIPPRALNRHVLSCAATATFSFGVFRDLKVSRVSRVSRMLFSIHFAKIKRNEIVSGNFFIKLDILYMNHIQNNSLWRISKWMSILLILKSFLTSNGNNIPYYVH